MRLAIGEIQVGHPPNAPVRGKGQTAPISPGMDELPFPFINIKPPDARVSFGRPEIVRVVHQFKVHSGDLRQSTRHV